MNVCACVRTILGGCFVVLDNTYVCTYVCTVGILQLMHAYIRMVEPMHFDFLSILAIF